MLFLHPTAVQLASNKRNGLSCKAKRRDHAVFKFDFWAAVQQRKNCERQWRWMAQSPEGFSKDTGIFSAKTPLGNGYSNKHSLQTRCLSFVLWCVPKTSQIKASKGFCFFAQQLFMWTDWDTFIISRYDTRLGCHRSRVHMHNDLFTRSLFAFMGEGTWVTKHKNWRW